MNPPHNRTPTSIAAAREIAGRAGTLRRAVYEFILDRRDTGATNDEVSAELGMQLATVCARVNELASRRLIVKAGERLNRNRKRCQVWVAAKPEPKPDRPVRPMQKELF